MTVWRTGYICRTRYDSMPEDYEGYTVAELREILKMRGLKVSGNRAELVDRLSIPKDPFFDPFFPSKILLWAFVVVFLPMELCAWGGILLMGYVWWAMSTSNSLTKRNSEESRAINHKRIFGEYPKK